MPTDQLADHIVVGDVVNVPMVVTAVGGTTAEPTVTGTTKYAGFDGNTDSITVDANQVIQDK